jgi:hypothetical protein
MTLHEKWIARTAIWFSALLVAASVCGCASLREAEVREVEDMLAAAGFTMKPADTADKLVDVGNLPRRQFAVIRRDGEPYYVFADPDVCRCVWVGDQHQYSRFQQLRLQKRIADEQLMAAQAWRDAAFRWSVWGPWPWF